MSAQAVQSFIDMRRRRRGEDIPLHRRRNRDVWAYIQLRWNLDGATGAEIAAELGTTEANVGMMTRTMREAGVYVKRRQTPRRAAA